MEVLLTDGNLSYGSLMEVLEVLLSEILLSEVSLTYCLTGWSYCLMEILLSEVSLTV